MTHKKKEDELQPLEKFPSCHRCHVTYQTPNVPKCKCTQNKYAMIQHGPMAHSHFLSLDVDRKRRERREGPAVELRADLGQMPSRLSLGERLSIGQALQELGKQVLEEWPECGFKFPDGDPCGHEAEFQLIQDGKKEHLYTCRSHMGKVFGDNPGAWVVPILSAR